MNVIKKRKQKKSILDPFKDEIEYYVGIGITVPNITKLINEKAPIRLSETTYRHFIKSKLLTNYTE